MHHRPAGRARTSPARRSSRSPAVGRALLVLALALVAAAGAALTGQSAQNSSSSPGVVDAAAHRGAQGLGTAYAHAAPSAARDGAGGANAPAPHGNGRHGDHQREQPQQQQAATETNPNCSLVVPAAPTTAAGLATPYQLVATDPGAGACHETNTDQSAFVEAAVFDPAAHA